jgi:hypothetical protein
MTFRALDACCLLLTLFPGLPFAMAAVAYEQGRYSQPYTGFSADGEVTVPGPCAPVPPRDRDSRDAA